MVSISLQILAALDSLSDATIILSVSFAMHVQCPCAMHVVSCAVLCTVCDIGDNFIHLFRA